MTAPRKLGQWIETETSDVRATLLWDRVRARTKPASRRTRWAAGAIVGFAAAAAIAFFIARRTAVDHVSNAQAVVYDDTGAMLLADGSRVRLRDNAHVRVEHVGDRIELTLVQGTAEFDVVHVAGRPFLVHAERADIVDVGTRFVVTREPSATRVEVREGTVEVRDPRGVLPTRTIAAGEAWSNGITTDAPSASAADSLATPSATATASAPRQPASPKALLEAADSARVAGRSREAAALLDELRRHHRSDARAGLAAFQLGRLRLDTLSDPAGAVEAFDDTIALAPNASFREDAEARRVEALERARDPRCREAKDAYLVRYPRSVHLAEVTARCER
ncbi:MAG TPA: FecR domain-containing protein [Polyangiaceae bacterium]|jgi:transmembrane sensor|nr:FecR domain-containing protein [Polyangiaceae bacterium]